MGVKRPSVKSANAEETSTDSCCSGAAAEGQTI